MTGIVDPTFLSRLQFALTTMFHILWPLLSIGLSLLLVVLEAWWLRTGDRTYFHHARFWGRLLALNFVVGVVSGIPLEFQFGANWARFSQATGGFFGTLLGFEGTMAFMLEAAFLYVMLFGWRKVSPRAHLVATCMVAFGASLSAFWIMAANSWMQTPAGGHFQDGRFVTTDFWAAIFNPDLPWGFSHMWVACLETSLMVVGGISAWYLLRGVQREFFLKSFKLALAGAILVAPLQVLLGDSSGRAVAELQPAKLGAIEAHWRTNPLGEGAAWNAIAWPDPEHQRNHWALEVPYALSLLLTHTPTGTVQGLAEFPRSDQPPVLLPFLAFRVMLGVGFALVGLMLWSAWTWRRGGLAPETVGDRRWLLWAWMAAAPLAYLAVETGWIVREVGRQPWVIYGWMRTSEASSPLPAGAVGVSLAVYGLIYTALLALFLVFAARILSRGPDLTEEPPPLAGPLPAAPPLSGEEV